MIVEDVAKGLDTLVNDGQYEWRHRLSSSGRCVRARVYQGRGVAPSNERDWNSMLAMVRGDDIEDLALRLLFAADPEKYHSPQAKVIVEIEGLGGIAGHVDCLVGDDAGLDVKGVNSSGWGRVKTHGPHEAYVEQCNMYMRATKRNKWYILYVNRDGYPREDFPFMVCEINYDADMADAAARRFLEVEMGLHGMLPPRPYASKNEFPCLYCDYRDRCFDDAIENVKERTKNKVGIEDEGLASVASLYDSLKEDERHVSDALKDVRAKIMAGMELQELAKAVVTSKAHGSWDIGVSVRKTKRLNKDMIPEEILHDATEETEYEVLTVKRFD